MHHSEHQAQDLVVDQIMFELKRSPVDFIVMVGFSALLLGQAALRDVLKRLGVVSRPEEKIS
jgi:hypothetical protein